MIKPVVARKNGPMSSSDVFIGRPSPWGNPFIIGRDGNRDEVITKYRDWIMTKPELLAKLPALSGKRLICFCYPLRCHGDVLADLVMAAGARPTLNYPDTSPAKQPNLS